MSREMCGRQRKEVRGEGDSINGGKGRRDQMVGINSEINKSYDGLVSKEASSVPVSQDPERKAFVCLHSC